MNQPAAFFRRDAKEHRFINLLRFVVEKGFLQGNAALFVPGKNHQSLCIAVQSVDGVQRGTYGAELI